MKFLKRIINFIFSILLLVIAVLLINGLINKGVYVTSIDLYNENIPEELMGYKIMQITDVHSIRSKEQGDEIVNKIKKENPNIIFITGDLIDAEHYSEENIKYENKEVDVPEKLTLNFCEELTKIAEVYFVYGNHELMLLDDPEENVFKKELENLGIRILNNKVEYIKLGEEEYRLVGIQDPATLYKDKKYAFIGESNKERTESILHDLFLEQRDVFTMVLSHRPEYFDMYKEYDIDIAFTGHAHGGIMRIPFVGGVYAHAQGWMPKYTSGVYKSERFNMIVGRGIGNSTIDLRIFNPPELVLTTLLKN